MIRILTAKATLYVRVICFSQKLSINTFSSFEDVSAYKIPSSHVDWCKFCIYLTSLDVRHFGKGDAIGLNGLETGHLQWHDLLNEFHKNILICSEYTTWDKGMKPQSPF
jgi:hypothetical protein